MSMLSISGMVSAGLSLTSDVTDPVKLGICRSALMIATLASHTGRAPSATRNRGGSA